MSSTKRLISNSVVIFIGMTIANLFAYLFNMSMGRQLGPSQYGELMLLMSFFMVASVAGGAISTVAMRYSGELFFSKEYEALNRLYSFIFKNVLIFALALVILILIFIRPLANFFSIASWVSLLPVLLATVFFLLLMVNKGVLQGLQRFTSVSFLGAIEMVMRLAIATALVLAGWKLYGALTGVALGSAFAFIASIWSIRKAKLNSETGEQKKSSPLDRKEMIRYATPVLISSTMLVLSLNMDIFLVKHYFDPDQAGQYAAISVIAKIVLYVGSPIISVMFPMISEQRAKGGKHYKIFLYSLILTLMASLLVLAVFSIAPGTTIKLLYGTKYTALHGLLPTVGFAFLFYSLVNLMTNYYMAIKDFVFVWFYLATLILQVVSVLMWHDDLQIVARIFVFSFGFLFLLMLGRYILSKRSQIAAYLRGNYE